MSQGAKIIGGSQPGNANFVNAHPGTGVKGTTTTTVTQQQPSFLGSLFNKRERKLSHSEELQQQNVLTAANAQGSPSTTAPYGRTTEV